MLAKLQKKRVLIVEDETIVALNLARMLEKLGIKTVGLASSEEDAVKQSREKQPDLVLMDINLGEGGSGITAAKIISDSGTAPVVYTTAYTDDATLNSAVTASPYGYVVKPYNIEHLKSVMMLALERNRIEQETKSNEKRLQMVSKAANLGVLEFDEKEDVLYFQGADALSSIFDCQNYIPRKDFMKLFPESEYGELEQAIKDNKSFRTTLRIQNRNADEQSYTWYDIILSDVHLDDTKTVRIGAILDVTDEQLKKQSLIISDVIIKEINEGVLVLDKQHNVVAANKALCGMLGKEENDLMGLPLANLVAQKRSTDTLDNDIKMKGAYRTEVSLRRNDQTRTCLMSVTRLDDTIEPSHYVSVLTDITRIKESERKLSTMAFKDSLTGAGNRNYMSFLLNRAKQEEQKIALIFLDLDSFKLINDNYGHDVGDQVLIQCANLLFSIIRTSDKLIRLGGDEFVVLSYDPDEHLEVFANRLLALFDKPFVTSAAQFKVTASIGIATTMDCSGIDNLLKSADIAMYKAKDNGKNTIAFFHDGLRRDVEYRLFIEQGLHDAISNEEITAHYQPIVDRKGRVHAVEALARWSSPGIGTISPDKFIPIAEETKLIHELGLKILREACIALKLIEERGLPELLIHVNVSNVQLMSPTMVSDFKIVIDDFDVDVRLIVLEITESTLHSHTTRHQLLGLRKLGFTISIDDFGTGYSTLSELKRPIYDFIKLDRSLLPTQFDAESKDHKIVKHLIAMCTDVGIPITFEGVESSEQVAFSYEMGCTWFQGYYFAKAMHLFELIRYLKNHDESLLHKAIA